MEAYLLIGKIIGVHGVRGSVKVFFYDEAPDIFETECPLLILEAGGKPVAQTIDWVKPHKRGFLMAFHDIQDRESAEALLQAEIYIKKDDLPALEEDTYYWYQLIGLSVFDTGGGCLGRIDSVMTTGSNDVYVVKDADRGPAYEVLVPALASVVHGVDLANGTMMIELPPGL